MEILKNEDGLLDEIKKDAASKAETIMKKAGKEAAKIKEETDISIKTMLEKMEQVFTAEVESEKKRITSTVEIDVRKAVARKMGELIDTIFDTVKEKMQREKFAALIKALLVEAADAMGGKGFVIESDAKTATAIGKENLKNIPLKTGKITDVIEKSGLEGMVIYSEDRKKSSFISMDLFFDQLKELYRNDIYRMLTEAK